MNYLRDHDQEVIANLIFSLFLSLVLKFQFQEESLMGLDSVAQHPLPSETRYLDYQYVMTLPNGAKLSPITPTRCKCILERKNNPNLHMALLVFPSQGWRVGINTVYR